jgi:hypothetical protein
MSVSAAARDLVAAGTDEWLGAGSAGVSLAVGLPAAVEAI